MNRVHIQAWLMLDIHVFMLEKECRSHIITTIVIVSVIIVNYCDLLWIIVNYCELLWIIVIIIMIIIDGFRTVNDMQMISAKEPPWVLNILSCRHAGFGLERETEKSGYVKMIEEK